jgi:hypothetical protein
MIVPIIMVITSYFHHGALYQPLEKFTLGKPWKRHNFGYKLLNGKVSTCFLMLSFMENLAVWFILCNFQRINNLKSVMCNAATEKQTNNMAVEWLNPRQKCNIRKGRRIDVSNNW